MFGIEPIAAVRLMCSNRQTSGLGKILVKDSTDSVPAPHGDKLKLMLKRNTGLLGIVQSLQVVVTKQDNRTGPIPARQHRRKGLLNLGHNLTSAQAIFIDK